LRPYKGGLGCQDNHIRESSLPRKCPNHQGVFVLHGIGLGERPLHPLFTASLIIAMLALVGVFIEIPFVSRYAFWVLFGAYILLAGRK
jgi:hypothetical protein